VRVAALNAGLPAAEPFLVLILRELAVLPEKEIRLGLIGRPKDVRLADEPFLKERIRVGIDGVDAAILIVGNPDQETIGKCSITLQFLAGFAEMDGYLVKQKLRIGVPASNRGGFDLESFQEGFNIIRRHLRAEDQMKIDPTAGL
jgi:hypothetical protein